MHRPRICLMSKPHGKLISILQTCTFHLHTIRDLLSLLLVICHICWFRTEHKSNMWGYKITFLSIPANQSKYRSKLLNPDWNPGQRICADFNLQIMSSQVNSLLQSIARRIIHGHVLLQIQWNGISPALIARVRRPICEQPLPVLVS